jgi:hypothetical protein
MAAAPNSTQANLSAAEIVSRNVTARGGLQAWRAVKSMSWQGKLGVGGNQRATLTIPSPDKKAGPLPSDPRPAEEVQLPFVMEMERPLKVRFELQFKGQTAVQVFDGTSGWKLRPYLNRNDVEPYTADEMKKAALQQELDGPLVDYQAKGTTVSLDGAEKVEGRDTYKLKLTLKSGQTIHVWIDAKTFLEAKIEGQPRRLDGIEHPVEVYYRDYRSVNGLQIPFVLETAVLPLAATANHAKEAAIPTEKIIIERVVVNPRLDASIFVKPEMQTAKLTH